jgi:hypothetical protein
MGDIDERFRGIIDQRTLEYEAEASHQRRELRKWAWERCWAPNVYTYGTTEAEARRLVRFVETGEFDEATDDFPVVLWNHGLKILSPRPGTRSFSETVAKRYAVDPAFRTALDELDTWFGATAALADLHQKVQQNGQRDPLQADHPGASA